MSTRTRTHRTRGTHFSPVWIRLCLFSANRALKPLLQLSTSQTKGFSPVWTRRCALSDELCLNTLPQPATLHRNMCGGGGGTFAPPTFANALARCSLSFFLNAADSDIAFVDIFFASTLCFAQSPFDVAMYTTQPALEQRYMFAGSSSSVTAGGGGV